MQELSKERSAGLPLDQRFVLHLGAGMKYHADAVNVDRVADIGPDVVHDLDQFPWPFPDNRFREVWAYDVIEHLSDVVKVMEEIHRVCQPGAILRLTVPHYSCANAFTDITHRHFFSSASFDYFTGDNDLGFYTRCRFRMKYRQINFTPTLVNKIVWRLANRFPARYERRWAWLFPAWFIYAELEVLKPPSTSHG